MYSEVSYTTVDSLKFRHLKIFGTPRTLNAMCSKFRQAERKFYYKRANFSALGVLVDEDFFSTEDSK